MSSLWLKYLDIRIITSGALPSIRQHRYVFQRGWRDASAFDFDKLRFKLTPYAAPGVPENAEQGVELTTEEDAMCQLVYASQDLAKLSAQVVVFDVQDNALKRKPVRANSRPYYFDFNRSPVPPILTTQPPRRRTCADKPVVVQL